MGLHKDIDNSNRHNPKDFESASNSTVLSKDANGNLEWVSKSDVGGSQGPQGDPGPVSSTANVKTVQLVPQVGQYSLITDAIAAITDASESNPYYINLGPGTYTETSTIVMKPWVYVRGAGKVSRIVFNFSGNHGVRGSDYSAFENCFVTFNDMTNSGYALFYHENTVSGAGNRNFVVKNCHVGWSDIGVMVKTTTYATQINVFDFSYGGAYSCNYMFKLDGSGATATARIISESLRPIAVAVPRPYALIYADGNVEFVGSSFLANSGGNALSGHTYGASTPPTVPSPGTLGKYGIYIQDGATVRMIGGTLRGWDTAIYAPNVGSGSKLDIQGMYIDRNINSIVIEHPDTSGAIFCQAEGSKITIDSAANDLTLMVSDIESGAQGMINLGKLRIAPGGNYSGLFDLAYASKYGVTSGRFTGGMISVNAGLTVDITAGRGFFYDVGADITRDVTWTAKTAQVITANSDVYLVVNSAGNVVETASISVTENVILLGRVVTAASSIRFIENLPAQSNHALNKILDFHRKTFGCVYESGSTVAENGSVPFNLDVGSGVRWFMGNDVDTAGGSQITFTQIYPNGSGGWTETTLQTVNATQYYSGGGALSALSAGYFSCRYLYIVGSSTDSTEKYYLQIGENEHASLALAQAESIPNPPSWLKDGSVAIARIIIKQGDADIITNGEIVSLKPTLGGAAVTSGGGGGSSDHGSLLGLGDESDHPWALWISGGNAMTGDLNLGTNDVINGGTYNSVTVEAHKGRHDFGGADALNTATPVSINATNAQGSSNSWARAEHTHKVTVESIGAEVSLRDSLIGFHSAGVVYPSQGIISDAGGGTVDISAATVYVRASASPSAALYAYAYTGTSGLALTDNALNYIYLNYNAGSPNVTATTVESSDRYSKVLLGTVYREGSTLHIAQFERALVGDHARSMSLAMRQVMPYARKSNDGGLITHTGTRNFAISAYSFWHGLEDGTIAAVNTLTGDQFRYWYNRGSYAQVTGQTQLSNTQYDNAGTLTALPSGKYRADFVYFEVDGDIEVIYGNQAHDTVGQAAAEAPPLNLPAQFAGHAIYMGKVIVQEGASSFAKILGAFASATEDFVVTDHTELVNSGTNTHAQIDSHIASTANPHSTTIDHVTPTTTKGDIIAENGSNAVRLPVGTNGQVLAANSATATGLEWQTISASITYYNNTATAATSTTSTTYVTLDSMTRSLTTGVYLVLFSSSGSCTATGADGNYAIHLDGAIQSQTERRLNFGGGAATGDFDTALNSMGIVSVTGTQTIDVKYKVSTGTLNVYARNLIFIKVG